jgi:hypothetical protein
MNMDARRVPETKAINAKHMGVVSDVLNQIAPKVPKVRLINA